MRIARVGATPALVEDDSWVDLPAASDGRFADPDAIFADWAGFLAWARDLGGVRRHPLDAAELGIPPVPARQVFGAGLNYGSHLTEAGRERPELPLFFTKFPSSLCGPDDDVELATDMVDFEAELVVVMGSRADRVAPEQAWSHVAGLTAGQDISARDVQRSGQLSIGKSFRTFAPVGPWISTLDDFDDPDDLALHCTLNGSTVQQARTSDMVFGVAELVSLLSAVTPLLPGDLVFTGTPSGVGVFREPPLFLRPGDVLTTSVEGVGTLRNHCVAMTAPNPQQRLWATHRGAPGPPRTRTTEHP